MRYTKKGALISTCGNYRYWLSRSWYLPMVHEEDTALLFIGLNPSTADETEDDPTIRRCVWFADREGYTSLLMCNLFAYRATDSSELKKTKYPVGPENDRWLLECHEQAGKTIAAWGVNASLDRVREVRWLRRTNPDAKTKYVGDDFWCLGVTKDGHPKHPLYLSKSTPIRRVEDAFIERRITDTSWYFSRGGTDYNSRRRSG